MTTETDERLLSRLATLLGRLDDPVPDHVRAAAEASFDWRTVDAELAALVYDSALDDERLMALRGPAGRQLTFEAGGLVVEVQVEGPDRQLVGQLVPPQRAEVEIRSPRSSVTVTSDDLGRFRSARLPAGPFSLRCRLAANRPPTETEWVVV
ncbi:MAG: hypothetical protein ACRD0D_02970 [Acidimicrobiales bacterium]